MKFEGDGWEEDVTQPVGATDGLAVDPEGNPAFISSNKIWWRRGGKQWIEIEGCGIAFGQNDPETNTFPVYKYSCNHQKSFVYQLTNSTWT